LQREFEDTEGLDLLEVPAAGEGVTVVSFLLMVADSKTVHTAVRKVRDKLGGSVDIEVEEVDEDE